MFTKSVSTSLTTLTTLTNPNEQKSGQRQQIKPQELDRIVEAILQGKYSWACVLFLRYVGYNPIQYLPYRTYNRLLKENSGCITQANSRTRKYRRDTEPTREAV